MKKVLLLIMLFSLATVARAEIFDFQGPSGRAIALGGAYTGLVTGAEGIAWNPGATGFGDSIFDKVNRVLFVGNTLSSG